MLLFSLALVVSAVRNPPPQVLGGRAWVGGPGWEELPQVQSA